MTTYWDDFLAKTESIDFSKQPTCVILQFFWYFCNNKKLYDEMFIKLSHNSDYEIPQGNHATSKSIED